MMSAADDSVHLSAVSALFCPSDTREQHRRALECTSSGEFAWFCINLPAGGVAVCAQLLALRTFQCVCSLVLHLRPELPETRLLDRLQATMHLQSRAV